MRIRRQDQSSGRRLQRMSSELGASATQGNRGQDVSRDASWSRSPCAPRLPRQITSLRTRLGVGHAVLLMSQPMSRGSLAKMMACRWRRLVEVALSSRAPRRGAGSLCAAPPPLAQMFCCVCSMCGRERRRRGAPSPQRPRSGAVYYVRRDRTKAFRDFETIYTALKSAKSDAARCLLVSLQAAS